MARLILLGVFLVLSIFCQLCETLRLDPINYDFNTRTLRRRSSPCKKSDQFECNNGECIQIDGKCNGIAECQDASDESEKLCLNIKCPGYTYKCRYGACVDGDAMCNNVKDCFDNSDEDEKTCGPRTLRLSVDNDIKKRKPRELSKTCITPNQPENGKWKYLLPDNSVAVANKTTPHRSAIIFGCNKDFQLLSSSYGSLVPTEIFYCQENGQWSPTVFPTCQRKFVVVCPKLYNRKHAILQCKLDGSIIPCNKATHGTQLTYTCDPYYEPVLTSINVCVNGEWQQPEPKCIEVCGEKQVSAQTLIVNGKVSKRGSYPWVVALYSNRKNDNPSIFTNICGGSLISTSIVLTAAHCVTLQSTGEVYAIEYFRVAAGKYYNKYMDTRDMDTAQYLTVKNIVKYPHYRGELQNFRYDIALMKLKTPFTLSKVVQPVCLKTLTSLQSSDTATVTGWGYTTTSGNPSDALNEIDLDYVDNKKCETELDPEFARQYLISDKFCAGLINKNMGVCKGDSGGGLVVKGSNDRFFVKGIVSLVKPFLNNSQVHCDVQRRALFTRVDLYLEWIQSNMLTLL